MWPIFGEVAPPPEVLIPADAGVAAALGGLLGWLAGVLRPVRDAIVDAVKWVLHVDWEGLRIAWHFTQDLNVGVRVLRSWVTSEIEGLVRAIAATQPVTVVQVTSNVAGAVQALQDRINGGVGYAVSVAEDLYNRANTHAEEIVTGLHGYVDGTAHNLQANIDRVTTDVGAYVGQVAGAVATHADAVASDALHSALDAVGAVQGYVDGVAGHLEGELGDMRGYVDAAVAGVGAALFAKVITTVKDLYDPCCEFTTDQVKPQWDKVKGLLGKLTRRGPLALVVLGAASEAVVALDRPTIVAMIKQARADDGRQSLTVLHDWRRPGVA